MLGLVFATSGYSHLNNPAGVLTQLAGFGLILISAGGGAKKIFGGEKASGSDYDLMLMLMNLVIASTNGGAYVLMK